MKKQGWLIYYRDIAIENAAYIKWFIEEAQLQNMELKLMIREDMEIGINTYKNVVIYKNEAIPVPDFAVVRLIDPMLSLHLEEVGIHVFNSSSVSRICNDKALTHHHMNKLGLPMVETHYRKKENLSKPSIAYPLVCKEVNGKGGERVYFINKEEEWNTCVKNIQSDYILQSTNVQLGKDMRVYVIGKKIVGAVLRESTTADFRANYTLGGSAKWYELKPEERETINKIIDYFDFGLVGIDFLIDHQNNLVFNEIEDVVGSRTISAVSNINILREYVTYIKNKLQKSGNS